MCGPYLLKVKKNTKFKLCYGSHVTELNGRGEVGAQREGSSWSRFVEAGL